MDRAMKTRLVFIRGLHWDSKVAIYLMQVDINNKYSYYYRKDHFHGSKWTYIKLHGGLHKDYKQIEL